jgi:hypothetical protein
VREVASWLNRQVTPDTPLRIVATARSNAEAESLGQRMRSALLPLIPGDSARVAVQTRASDGAPADGTLLVEALASGAPRSLSASR